MRSAIRLRSALLLLALAIGLFGGAVTPSAAAAAGRVPVDRPFGLLRPLAPPASSDDDRIVELVNAERALAGLPPLTRHAGLATAAGEYATAMASPTHRANVLSDQACDIGVGRATGRGTRYDVYWVIEIGCGLFSS